MFRKGEYVIYGNNGICCIEEIGDAIKYVEGKSQE